MALLAACASSAFLTSTTWALVDGTSYSASEAANTPITTSYVTSSTFTPGAITIDGIGIKVASCATNGVPVGTITVALDLATVTVTGTEVAINVSDIPFSTAVAVDGGWVFFKFAAPVLLVVATAYGLKIKSSSSSQVNVFSTATSNWSRYLRTTTTQAPTTGDDMIITKEWTAAATGTALTVTMDCEATTDHGSAPTAANSLLTPGIAICNGGTLTFGTTATKNYYLKLSNSLIVYNGGTLNIGTTGTPLPRDGSAVLEFDPGADGDYGLLIRGQTAINTGGTLVMQGLSRTAAKLITRCKLNADEAANSTSLGVDTDTGWLDNDQIAVASTTRTAAQSEVGTLNGAANASDMTVDGFAGTAGGLLNAHSGTSPTQAEVILLTRNVRLRSATSTIMAYVFCDLTSVVDIDWAEFYYLGENAGNKRGIEVATTTGSFNMQFSSLHDCEDFGFVTVGAAGNNFTFSSNVMWSLASVTGPGATLASATSGTSWTIDSNILIKTTSGNGWTLADVGGTFTNNTAVSAAAAGISLTEFDATIATFTGNVAHSCATSGFLTSSGVTGSLGITAWRNSGVGYQPSVTTLITVTGAFFGNTTHNIQVNSSVNLVLINSFLHADTTFATTNGIGIGSTSAGVFKIIIDSCDFSTASGIKTAHTNDIGIGVVCTPQIVARNTILAGTNEVSSQTNIRGEGFVSAQKLDQTAGNHKTFVRYGNLQTDSTTFNTASPSLLMTPNNASNKLESATQFRGFKVAVANGATVTPTVQVRKSATYNGNQPRLIVKANPALGIASDTVLDTMTVAVANWEELTGTTASVSDDGELEFVVDCDGTVGTVNVDDWAHGGTDDVRGLKYWFNGLPAEWIPPTPSAGGGGGLRIAGRGGLAAGA